MSAWLPLLSACNSFVVFDTSVFCQLFLSRLIHSSGGKKFGIFRELLAFCITTPRPGPAV